MVSFEVVFMTAVTTLIGLVVTSIYRQLSKYTRDSMNWRASMDASVSVLMKAQQSTMRATLIHNAEKYFERGWLTPEERASWCDMHDHYSALGANGLIETYRHKLNELPDKTID